MTLLVALVTFANVVGVRQATWIVNVMTVAKVLPLALLIVLGLPQVERAVLQTQVVATPDWTQAILLLVFAYGGFEAALIPAGEVKDPRRDMGFALLTSLGIIATVYMLVQLVVVGVVPNAAGAKAPIAAAFGAIVGPSGVLLASLAAVLSISGWTMGNILASPRVLFSMADRGVLPRVLARVHEHYRTPHVAIVVYALLALAFGLGGTFAGNAMLAAIVRLVYYGLTCAALFVFRRRSREAARLPSAGRGRGGADRPRLLRVAALHPHLRPGLGPGGHDRGRPALLLFPRPSAARPPGFPRG